MQRSSSRPTQQSPAKQMFSNQSHSDRVSTGSSSNSSQRSDSRPRAFAVTIVPKVEVRLKREKLDSQFKQVAA